MSVVVDALGKQCPIPVVMAKKALAELQTPDTLEILVDNEAAVQNLSKLAASCQLPVRAEKTGEKRFSVTMEVSAPVQPAEETVCAPDARGDLVVAVGSNCMGNGEETLGKALMKGFLYAVSQLPTLPKTILFYNSGAYLTCDGVRFLGGSEVHGGAGRGDPYLRHLSGLLQAEGDPGRGQHHQYVRHRGDAGRRRESHQAMIYLDNAATTRQKPQPVIDAVVSAMTTLGNSARGTHEGSLSASRTIYGTREKLATFFNCPRPDHVVFTANSTEALNMAICGLLDPGDHVIATDLEHNSVLRPLYRLEAERSVSLSFVPADRQGRIDYGDFERLIRPETRAIVCTHASNLTGNAVDIGRVGAIAHAHGLIFLVDASQTAGVLPIDMEAQQIDLLCFTGHKSLMGPQGTGGLCLGRGRCPPPMEGGGHRRPDLQPRPAGAAAYTVGGGDPQRPRHRRTVRRAGLYPDGGHGDHPGEGGSPHAPVL